MGECRDRDGEAARELPVASAETLAFLLFPSLWVVLDLFAYGGSLNRHNTTLLRWDRETLSAKVGCSFTISARLSNVVFPELSNLGASSESACIVR